MTKDAAALALGREAVNEAELELKAWRDSRGSRDAADGYVRDPRGLIDAGEGGTGFPVTQAMDLLRCRIMGYSVSTCCGGLTYVLINPHIDFGKRQAGCRNGKVVDGCMDTSGR